MARKSSDSIQIYLEHGIDIPGRRIDLTSCSDGNGEEAGIDWQIADRVVRGLHLLGNSELPIHLVINSHGGEDDHCRAIIAAIRNCPAPVHGIVYGRAESAAAWILQVCDYRIISKGSNLMLHLGSSDKNNHSAYIDRLFIDDVLHRLREKDGSFSRSRLRKLVHNDWFIYPDEALELGLVDEVLE